MVKLICKAPPHGMGGARSRYWPQKNLVILRPYMRGAPT